MEPALIIPDEVGFRFAKEEWEQEGRQTTSLDEMVKELGIVEHSPVEVFAGKKILTLLCLNYHSRILLPIMQTLESRGATIEYFTAQAEAAFEITFKQNGLPYYHVSDFLTPSVANKVNTAYTTLSKEWQRLLLQDTNLQNVPLIIIDKILRAMVESHFGIEAIIDHVKPDIVFSLHELNSWGVSLGYHASKRGIPFFTFQEGLCYSAIPMYKGHTYFSNACFLWGDADRDVLIAAGNDSEKMPIVGNIDLVTAIQESNTPEQITKIRQEYHVGEDQKILLFLMGHSAYQQIQAPEFIKFLWEHREYIALFRFHPIQGVDITRNALSILGQIPSVRHVGADANPYDLMASADVSILVGASTTGIEALAFQRPLIQIDLPDTTYSYAEKGAVPRAATIEEAAAIAHDFIVNGLPHEWREKREIYLKQHFANYEGAGIFNGGTVNRILHIVGEHFERELHKRSAQRVPIHAPA